MRSKRIAFAASATATTIVALLALARSGEDPGGRAAASVQVRGVRVVGEGYGAGDRKLWPFDCRPGTTLALLVVVPQGGLVDFDEGASGIIKAADARGGNLLGKGQVEFSSARISQDRKACMLLARLPRVPAGGSASISVGGKLVLRRATRKLAASKEAVPLAVGTRLQLAGVPLEITGVRRLRAGPNRMEISLKSDRSFSRVAEIRFLDAEGREIRSQRWAGGYFRKDNEVQLNFGLTRALKTVTVRIDYWADMREVPVPFETAASLGL